MMIHLPTRQVGQGQYLIRAPSTRDCNGCFVVVVGKVPLALALE